MPGALPPQDAGLAVDDPELTQVAAQVLTDPTDDLGRGLFPASRRRQRAGNGILGIPQAIRVFSLADVLHKPDHDGASRHPPPGRDGQLHREFVAVAMLGGDLGRFPQQPAPAGLPVPGDASLVRPSEPTRDDGAGQAATKGFLGRPAEHPLGLAVPAHDHPPVVRGDHCAGRRVDDGFQLGLRLA